MSKTKPTKPKGPRTLLQRTISDKYGTFKPSPELASLLRTELAAYIAAVPALANGAWSSANVKIELGLAATGVITGPLTSLKRGYGCVPCAYPFIDVQTIAASRDDLIQDCINGYWWEVYEGFGVPDERADGYAASLANLQEDQLAEERIAVRLRPTRKCDICRQHPVTVGCPNGKKICERCMISDTTET